MHGDGDDARREQCREQWLVCDRECGDGGEKDQEPVEVNDQAWWWRLGAERDVQIDHLRGPRVEWEDLVPILEKIFVAKVGDLKVGESGKDEGATIEARGERLEGAKIGFDCQERFLFDSLWDWEYR